MHPARILPVVVAALMLGGCMASLGPNALVVPVTHKAMELAGHAVDAGMEQITGPKKAPEPIRAEDMEAKAATTCTDHNLTEAECARVKAQYAKTADFITRVQGVQVVADEQRKAQRAAAFNPANILTDVAGGAVGHGMALESAGWAGTLSGALQ